MVSEFEKFSEEWNRQRRTLFEIDETLKEIATAHHLELIQDDHDRPGRDLLWMREGIHRKIQIDPSDQLQKTYFVALLGWEDRGSSRWSANPNVRRDVTQAELKNVLEHGIRELNDLTRNDLQPPGSIRRS